MSRRPKPEANRIDDALLLSTLMDQLPDAVYFKDRESRFLRINRALAAWYALKDPAEAIGKSDADFYPPEFARATLEAEQRIVDTGIPVLDQEETCVGRDGKTRWVSSSKHPLLDAAGRIVGTYGISRDMRSQKRAEEKVRDSEALYQSLIECLPQAIFRKDVQGRYVYVNRRLCESLGRSPAALLGKTDYDVNPRPLADKYREDDEIVMRTQKLLDRVEAFRPKGQKKSIRIRVTKTPVYDSRGRVVGVQGIFWPVDSDNAR